MNGRARLIDILYEGFYISPGNDIKGTAQKAADYLIANGVTVQRHGRWEYHDTVCTGDGLEAVYACSECHSCIDEEAFEQLHSTDYCPSCGAKMDGEADG